MRKRNLLSQTLILQSKCPLMMLLSEQTRSLQNDATSPCWTPADTASALNTRVHLQQLGQSEERTDGHSQAALFRSQSRTLRSVLPVTTWWGTQVNLAAVTFLV